jgi:hypothetical protein
MPLATVAVSLLAVVVATSGVGGRPVEPLEPVETTSPNQTTTSTNVLAAPGAVLAPVQPVVVTTMASPAPHRASTTARPVASAQPRLTIRANGQDRHIDLDWDVPRGVTVAGYRVLRSDLPGGEYHLLTDALLTHPHYCDFLGASDQQRWYRVVAVDHSGRDLRVAGDATARTVAQDDQAFMTTVQRATFRYFWDFAHPVSGLVRERSGGNSAVCATGGTGFGLFAIMIGAERGFVSRPAAVERILRILRFYDTKAERYHGAFAHWIDGRTGKTVPFSTYDDGGDIVETSFLVQGLLAVRQYFNGNDPQEIALRQTATRLWEGVNWSWYLNGGKALYWHWSPTHGWAMNLKVGGGFNETMITYLLAMSSPTHPIPEHCYHEGWVGDGTTYVNGSDYYGYTQWVGQTQGGPLFFTHYSFIGLDPRGLRDRYCDYFENNRNISLINRSYCIENPGGYRGYGDLVWGLTASDGPDGYVAHAPGLDNGTIAPTASISAMPYIPHESLATMRHLYNTYGSQLWSTYGFRDAFNPSRNWFAKDHLAIDQGPIICMIENHRTGLCWDQFMKNPEIHGALAKIAVKPEPDAGKMVEGSAPTAP